jgi:hypothetical protein
MPNANFVELRHGEVQGTVKVCTAHPDRLGPPKRGRSYVGYYVSYVYRANLYIRNTLRHRTGAISEGRAKCDGTNRRGQGHCKAGAP